MKKKQKIKVSKTYTVPNVTNQDDLLFIYNKVGDLTYVIEQNHKRETNKRKFDIADYWKFNSSDGNIHFNILNTAPVMIAIHLMEAFEKAHNYWLNNKNK